MQITAFKAILARRINIQGCEDYFNVGFYRSFLPFYVYRKKITAQKISYDQKHDLTHHLRV